jgi:hypothetical protein
MPNFSAADRHRFCGLRQNCLTDRNLGACASVRRRSISTASSGVSPRLESIKKTFVDGCPASRARMSGPRHRSRPGGGLSAQTETPGTWREPGHRALNCVCSHASWQEPERSSIQSVSRFGHPRIPEHSIDRGCASKVRRLTHVQLPMCEITGSMYRYARSRTVSSSSAQNSAWRSHCKSPGRETYGAR